MNTLTSKQAVLLCSIMLFASKLLVLPSLLYSSNGAGGILSVLFIFLLEFIFLFILIKIKRKNPKINFYNVFKNKLGVFLTKIILFLLFLFFIFKAIYILQESFTFLKHSLYTTATTLVYIVCILPIVTALAYKGLKSFGRTLEIFYALIIGLIVFCTLIWAFSIENFSFALLFQNGFSGFINSTFSYTFWFGDFVFIMYILDKVNFDSMAEKNFTKYAIISMIIIITFMVVYFFTFQSTSFIHTYAILDIIQFVSDFGTVGKFDIIAILAIMFIIYFQIGILLFCANDCLNKIIPFKHRAQSYIALNIFLIVSCYAIFDNANLLILFYSNYINIISLITSYLIPILFVIFSFQKQKLKKETPKMLISGKQKRLVKK